MGALLSISLCTALSLELRHCLQTTSIRACDFWLVQEYSIMPLGVRHEDLESTITPVVCLLRLKSSAGSQKSAMAAEWGNLLCRASKEQTGRYGQSAEPHAPHSPIRIAAACWTCWANTFPQAPPISCSQHHTAPGWAPIWGSCS